MNLKLFKKSILQNIKHFKINKIINQFDYYINVRFLNKKEIIRKVNNYPMVLVFQEEGISRNLMVSRTREVAETEIIRDIIKSGICVLEIGANIGYYTILMGKLIGKTGKIYTYEPYFPNSKVLLKNIKLNNLSAIVDVQNKAVSNETGIKKFYLGKSSNIHTLVNYDEKYDQSNYIEVQTVDINEILIKIDRKIDIMRMDIEGHEREIFNRFNKEIIRKLPERIFFEIHPLGIIDPDPSFTQPLTNLLKFGYYPEIIVASSNVNAYKRFRDFNYLPSKIINRTYLYNNIKASDLLKVAARRPKMTRAILLKRDE